MKLESFFAGFYIGMLVSAFLMKDIKLIFSIALVGCIWTAFAIAMIQAQRCGK